MMFELQNERRVDFKSDGSMDHFMLRDEVCVSPVI